MSARLEVPLFDLTRQHEAIASDLIPLVTRFVSEQRFILGAPVAAFESWLAGLCGTKHAIGVASGSDALFLAMTALGIGAGDAVITTPLSFVASAEAVARTGAVPIFADVDPNTLNLDPSRVDALLATMDDRADGSRVDVASGVRVRGILPVHLFGRAAEMDPLLMIARRYGLHVIEDAAQAIGATARVNDATHVVGSIGTAGCISFFPSKNLGAWGDGGAVVTNDDAVADRTRALRVHGASGQGESFTLGINSRLDALQAVVLRAKANHLSAWTDSRIRAANHYRELLANVADRIELPRATDGNGHVYHQFVIQLDDRDRVASRLAARGVETRAYYKFPLHRQPPFAQGTRVLPHAERASQRLLALPFFPEITLDEQTYVAEAITQAL